MLDAKPLSPVAIADEETAVLHSMLQSRTTLSTLLRDMDSRNPSYQEIAPDIQ